MPPRLWNEPASRLGQDGEEANFNSPSRRPGFEIRPSKWSHQTGNRSQSDTQSRQQYEVREQQQSQTQTQASGRQTDVNPDNNVAGRGLEIRTGGQTQSNPQSRQSHEARGQQYEARERQHNDHGSNVHHQPQYPLLVRASCSKTSI